MARSADTLNGFIDPGCTLRGELEFANSFRVDGRIEGTIRSRSELVIGEDGTVEGDVEVARCLVGGQVKGTIRGTEKVVLHASAKVWGEVHAPAVVMEEGAFLEGKIAMASADQKAESASGKG
jgi:cytoskeletal protein CcmA (bactofilin family)